MTIGPYGPSPGPPGTEGEPWSLIRARPTVILPLLAVAASKQLTTRPGIIVGWHIRDASGAAGAESAVTDVDNSANGAAAAMAATLPGAAGRTTYITGFEITGDGATAASTIAITVTGILGGTKSYFLFIPAGAGTAVAPMFLQYSRPIPASAPNTPIAVNVPSFGAGNLGAAVTAHGFQGGPNGTSSAAFIGDLFDGGDATGEIVASLSLGPDGTDFSDGTADGPYFKTGLFLNVIAGAVQGGIWVKI